VIREFVARDYERIVRVVAVVSGDRARAEDAVQDAVVDVWVKRRPVNDMASWVTTVAMNRVRSSHRRRAAERRAFDRLASRATRVESDAAIADARLARALGTLSDAQREAVALHYLLDMSVADVARQLGVTEGTVKTHLHRARATLRTTLDGRPEPEESDCVRS